MGSLNHRALLAYIEANDLVGLKSYLDSRSLSVDDRDEVIHFLLILKCIILMPTENLEWCYCTYYCCWTRANWFCS